MTEISQKNLLERYQRLIDLSKELASTFNLDVLLNRIVNAAADLSNASEASILLYDELKGELFFRAATNESAIRGLSVPVESSIAGWIITNREPLIIGDVIQDERHFKNITESIKIQTKSLLGVPLIAKNKVVGALEAINKKVGDFNQEDLEILMTLGAQAAIAIENARLFQQSDLVSEFVHEIRTPLSSIATAAQLLQYPQLPEGKRVKMAKVIQTESVRLSKLAASFLDLAKLESGRSRFNFQRINMSRLLDECADLMDTNAAEEGLTFQKSYSKDMPSLMGDADKIKQAIINLLSNAIKYNTPGGEIFLRSYVEDSNIIIEVEDTGIGIPEEHQSRLFEKFYRVPGTDTLSSGTGLGLTVVKRIVDGHNGTIEVISALGKGTIFRIILSKL